MELILNLNNYNYQYFLNSKVDIIAIGLESFCSGYLVSYSLDEIKNIITEIHNHNKKIYLSINIIANESTINNLISIIDKLVILDVDGYYVSDYGIFQVLKEARLTQKIVFNPVTTITNKYTLACINDFDIHHACVANELNLKEIVETAKHNKGDLEILAQGYYQICNSKRKLLTNFFKKFKIKNNSNHYFIKEENRDYAYPIIEVNDDLLIYIDKERCLLPYLKEIIDLKIKYLRIDTIFLNKEEIDLIIEVYSATIKNLSLIEESISKLSKTNSNFKCLDNISILKKEKNNE